jgi:hypothetical protein
VPVATDTYTGELRAAVFETAGGTIDFYYQVSNTGPGPTGQAQIARLTNFVFSGFMTDASFRTDGGALGTVFTDGSKPPVTADRDASGLVVGFSFQPPDASKIGAGEVSNVVVIQTDATSYEPGWTSVINGGTIDVRTFQPATAVPEPLALFLMGGGLIGLAGLRRLRKK